MAYIGYHDDHELPLKRGDVVTIKKGTVIKFRGGTKLAGKTYKVTIDHILPGMSRVRRDRHFDDSVTQNPSIRWPGPGGYWSEVDINDVVEPKP